MGCGRAAGLARLKGYLVKLLALLLTTAILTGCVMPSGDMADDTYAAEFYPAVFLGCRDAMASAVPGADTVAMCWKLMDDARGRDMASRMNDSAGATVAGKVLGCSVSIMAAGVPVEDPVALCAQRWLDVDVDTVPTLPGESQT